MARLPIPGSDSGDWGTILNTFLDVSLYNNVNNATDPDNGTLNSGVVGTAQIQNNAVTNTQLDSSTQTILSSVASKYVKPGGGIPYTDLAGNIPSSLLSSAVQTNLTSASTALQSSYTLSGGDLTGTIASPTVSKIKGVSISTPTGGTTSYLNASGTWTTPAGGGSSGTTQSYNLGSMGSNVTLQNPSTYGMQYGTLTANTALTLPSPSAGEAFLLVLIQDSTGGRIPSFVGSNATYPAGNPIWIEAANAINVLEIRSWDGNTWEIFPATSDVAPLNGIYLKLGNTSGVFPSASSPSTPSFRLVGATSSGAPTTGTFTVGDVALDLTGYWWFCNTAGTPGSWTQMSAGGGGSVNITSPDSSITVGGTGSAPTLQVGPSVVKVSSPATYSRPGYNGTSWVAENPRLVDITAEFSVSTSSSDNTLAINTALYTLGQKGIMGFLPPGTYKCATVGYVNSSGVPCASNASGAVATGSVITIGNGSLAAPSSWTGGLVGSFPSNGIYKASQASQQWPAINESVIKWTGGNNTSVANLNAFFLMQGPINGWKLENLVIDGNSSYSNGPYVGLAVVGSRFGRATDVVIKNVVNGLVLQALNLSDPNDGANGNNWQANTYQNTFERVQILYQGGSAATNSNMITAPWAGGWKAYANYGLTITSNGGPSNSCYNNFKECQIIPPASGGATNYGLCLQGCDSNRFEHLVVSSNTGQTYSIAMDYTNSSDGGEWPAGNVISGLELGGQTNAVKNIGGPANSSGSPTAGYNRFENISSVNGFTPNPLLGGLVWGGEFPVGYITLGNSNGTATINSSSSGYLASIFNLLVTTAYAPTTYVQSIETWVAQPGGTPGFVYATINYSGANPQNITFTSSSTTDTSIIGFRVVTT
jgi:hypothetical protein